MILSGEQPKQEKKEGIISRVKSAINERALGLRRELQFVKDAQKQMVFVPVEANKKATAGESAEPGATLDNLKFIWIDPEHGGPDDQSTYRTIQYDEQSTLRKTFPELNDLKVIMAQIAGDRINQELTLQLAHSDFFLKRDKYSPQEKLHATLEGIIHRAAKASNEFLAGFQIGSVYEKQSSEFPNAASSDQKEFFAGCLVGAAQAMLLPEYKAADIEGENMVRRMARLVDGVLDTYQRQHKETYSGPFITIGDVGMFVDSICLKFPNGDKIREKIQAAIAAQEISRAKFNA